MTRDAPLPPASQRVLAEPSRTLSATFVPLVDEATEPVANVNTAAMRAAETALAMTVFLTTQCMVFPLWITNRAGVWRIALRPLSDAQESLDQNLWLACADADKKAVNVCTHGPYNDALAS